MKKKISILLFITVLSSFVITANPFSKSGRHSSIQYSIPEGMIISQLDLKDGTYQGVANGFGTGLTVEITIEKGVLTSVEIISHNEVGSRFYSTPIKYIPSFIVDEQKSEVDAVSGATATSKGIMSAVEDALKKAI